MAARRPNYHHLRHFWVVAQEGSLLGASRKLGVRHSTLSTQLRSLEAALGVPLLLRRPRGVRLTPQGEIVRSYCDRIFHLGAELLQVTAAQRTARMRVGLLPSVPRSLLYAVLKPALERDEETQLQISVTDMDSAPSLLVGGRLDVVITDRLKSGGAPGSVTPHLVGESRIALYATPTLADRYRAGFPRSLDRAPLLMPGPGPVAEGLTAWFTKEGIRPKIVGEFDDVPMMQGFAARGHGLAPVRQVLGQEVRRRYGLVPTGSVPELTDRLYALTVGRRVRHPSVQRLIEGCREKLQAG
jgi:LysR family transcriptional regulator, transcriptional activator of nhaA